ncbi:substrate-binding domain-containing protein [Microbacterium amylolyticum]|uniref:substrate-binding domain-containing protein n=1 Tax=Microbacterium amylolyticum TaxID=936337 RepID=UPI0013E9FD59|nr:substrate-binding domain-containing protein [Microbacterium amylolyticum]
MTALNVLLVVAAIVIVSKLLTHGVGEQPVGAVAAAESCEARDSVRVVADPKIAGALEHIAAKVRENDCISVDIVEEDSDHTAVRLGAGQDLEFDAWVPDSDLWLLRAEELANVSGEEITVTTRDVVASTPIVLAGTESTAMALETLEVTWQGISDGIVSVVLPDPAGAAASVAALSALQHAVGDDFTAFTALVMRLHSNMVDASQDGLEAVSESDRPTIAITTEQMVRAYSDGAPTPLVSVYHPDVSTASAVPLATADNVSDDTSHALGVLIEAIHASPELLAEHGFRDASGQAHHMAENEVIVPVSAESHIDVLDTWGQLTAPSRMLSVIDVSGSMNDVVGGNTRRIDLFSEAAVLAVNALPDNTDMATWIFSSGRDGDKPWEEIVSFGSLGDPQHRQLTIDTARDLEHRVVGGTGLYDTVLDAMRFMRESYEPDKVNLILLNTDGVNEDHIGVELPELLDELHVLHDPENPVVVIAVGYGPDTDQQVLTQIAEATGGAAYHALHPTDIAQVLMEAVTQRACRPDCGG